VVELELKSPTASGQRVVHLHPVQFLRRIAWLIPPPGQNRVRYYGVFGPTHRLRAQVVPRPVELTVVEDEDADEDQGDRGADRYRVALAKLLAKVFDVDAERCPDCGGRLRPVGGVTRRGGAGREVRVCGGLADEDELAMRGLVPECLAGAASERSSIFLSSAARKQNLAFMRGHHGADEQANGPEVSLALARAALPGARPADRGAVRRTNAGVHGRKIYLSYPSRVPTTESPNRRPGASFGASAPDNDVRAHPAFRPRSACYIGRDLDVSHSPIEVSHADPFLP